MKVTIPITFTKYTPGPAVPARLVAISDEQHQADFLGVEYTDGSFKIPRYYDGENYLVIILNNGDINLMKDGDEYSAEMSFYAYEQIKDDYTFVGCECSVGYDEGNEIRVFWYDIYLEDVHFTDQKKMNELPDEVFMNPQNAIIFDNSPLLVSIDEFDERGRLLCVTKNGRKFVLFNFEDESAMCRGESVDMHAYDCSAYGVAGEGIPDTPYIALYRFSLQSCSVSEGVVNAQGRLNVTISGFEWNAFFNIQTDGDFEQPISSLVFDEA